jgi:hypothetical protein
MGLALLFASLGCTGGRTLPRSDASDSPFRSFDQIVAAFDQVEVGDSDVEALRDLQIDPAQSNSVMIRPYTAAIPFFLPHQGVDVTRHHPGVQECFRVRRACEVWLVQTERVRTRREGNWLLDVLRFRRNSFNRGFMFERVLLVIDDEVVYKLWNGIPSIDVQELAVRPLGIFQPAARAERRRGFVLRLVISNVTEPDPVEGEDQEAPF